MALSDRTTGVESARKALQMLLFFDETRPRATIAELARSLGVPLSSAYRQAALLRELGLIEDDGNGAYHVTGRVLPIARAADAVGGLAFVARPLLVDLVKATGETALLMRLFGDACLALDVVESPNPIRLTGASGRTLPLLAGAPAKLLLAALPASVRNAHLDRATQGDAAFAARRTAFETELATIRKQGWAASYGEIDPGLCAFAAPITQRDAVTAALMLGAPQRRLTAKRRAFLLSMVKHFAGEISKKLDAPAAILKSSHPRLGREPRFRKNAGEQQR